MHFDWLDTSVTIALSTHITLYWTYTFNTPSPAAHPSARDGEVAFGLASNRPLPRLPREPVHESLSHDSRYRHGYLSSPAHDDRATTPRRSPMEAVDASQFGVAFGTNAPPRAGSRTQPPHHVWHRAYQTSTNEHTNSAPLGEVSESETHNTAGEHSESEQDVLLSDPAPPIAANVLDAQRKVLLKTSGHRQLLACPFGLCKCKGPRLDRKAWVNHVLREHPYDEQATDLVKQVMEAKLVAQCNKCHLFFEAAGISQHRSRCGANLKRATEALFHAAGHDLLEIMRGAWPQQCVGSRISVCELLKLARHIKAICWDQQMPQQDDTPRWYSKMLHNKHAEYLINIRPKEHLNGYCAYELLTGIKPHDIRDLHPFGADAFAFDPLRRGGKLGPKARHGIYVGFSPTSLSHKVYCPDTNTIIETIHVKVVPRARDKICNPALCGPRFGGALAPTVSARLLACLPRGHGH
ncbi:uncharacterized protein MONBRDRAFT_24993 [Monosiga brevicollis MX1]|uniref:Retroviral polymerase SH3-like domain-containing protein n=1 Tax=Monosiga brevicollis TaxID=81824 RepID=A9UXG4_MONBE|nr:uncharacterized protein MONBRDRAFT_24993 [Monosiga brevicollis MX1]EDQ90001.1 predicted protein [Monosiga brevicollis MX1]|eukprot:XP_001745423.1 hypothetical protein [Monosiga brevicollis MX1]